MPLIAHADTWEMRAVIGNDAFDGLLSHPDDDGFTNDFSLALRWRRGDVAIGGSVLDRMITSSALRARTDLVETFARGTLVLGCLSIELRAGPTFAGDLGGDWVQVHWHRLSGTGPRDPRDTPARYMDGDTRAAGVTGLRAETGYGGPLRAYGTFDSQLAFGDTGVSFVEGAGGIAAAWWLGPVELGLFGEVALARYAVDDPALAMPGAYRSGWQVDNRIAVRVGVQRFRVALEYHTNETSSGEAFTELVIERR